jgi:hypothetical protein
LIKWASITRSWESKTVNQFKTVVFELPAVDISSSTKLDKIREIAKSLQEDYTIIRAHMLNVFNEK